MKVRLLARMQLDFARILSMFTLQPSLDDGCILQSCSCLLACLDATCLAPSRLEPIARPRGAPSWLGNRANEPNPARMADERGDREVQNRANEPTEVVEEGENRANEPTEADQEGENRANEPTAGGFAAENRANEPNRAIALPSRRSWIRRKSQNRYNRQRF